MAQQNSLDVMVHGKGDCFGSVMLLQLLCTPQEQTFFQSEGRENKITYFVSPLWFGIFRLNLLETHHRGRTIFTSDIQELLYDRSENWTGCGRSVKV